MLKIYSFSICISLLIVIAASITINDIFAQLDNEIIWKNYTNNYFNLTLEVPANWSPTDETSRFDKVKQFYVDTTGVKNIDPDNTVRIGISETDMTERGAKAYLEHEKAYITNPSDSGESDIRIIEDIQRNKYNISGGDSYSILYTDDDPTFPTATEKVAFVYNGKGYVIFNVVTPPRFFDNPNITETREKMINSIHFYSDNSTVYNIQQQTEKLNPQTINGQNLSLSLDSVKVIPINGESRLEVAFNAYNPNRGAAILETVSYNVYGDGVRLSSGDLGSRTEGFADSLESVYTIIGNQTIVLRDREPLTEDGLKFFDSQGNRIGRSQNNPQFNVSGSYYYTLNRNSNVDERQQSFSLDFPIR